MSMTLVPGFMKKGLVANTRVKAQDATIKQRAPGNIKGEADAFSQAASRVSTANKNQIISPQRRVSHIHKMPGMKVLNTPALRKTVTRFQSFQVPKNESFSKKDRLININVSGLTQKDDESSQFTAYFRSTNSKGTTSTT